MNKLLIHIFLLLTFSCQIIKSQEISVFVTVDDIYIESSKVRFLDTWLEETTEKIGITLINNGYDFGSENPENNIGVRGTISLNNKILFELNDTQISICANSTDLNQRLNRFSSGLTVDFKLNEITNSSFSGSNCNYMIQDQSFYNQVVTTNYLPRGIYQFCFEVFDWRNPNVPIGGIDCNFLESFQYQPPLLIQPYNGQVISSNERPNFKWTTVLPAPPEADEIFYIFKIVELQPGQDVFNAIKYNFTLFSVNQLNRGTSNNKTEAIWPEFLPLPLPGNTYAWSVQAVVPSNENSDGFIPATDYNDGYSEPFVFKVKSDEPELLFPEDVSTVFNNPVNFKWILDNPNGFVDLTRFIVFQTEANDNGYNIQPNVSNIIYEETIKDNNEDFENWYFSKNSLLYENTDNLYWTVEYIDRLDNQIKTVRPNQFEIYDESIFGEEDNQNNGPLLILPDGESGDIDVTFRWQKSNNAITNNLETTYDLYVVEVLEGQDLDVAIESEQYVISQENLKSTEYKHIHDRLFPRPGAVYAWAVYENILTNGSRIIADNSPLWFSLPTGIQEYNYGNIGSILDCYTNNNIFDIDRTSTNDEVDGLVDDTLKIGTFDIKIKEIQGTYSDASGLAEVYIPLINKSVETPFANVKINRNNEIYEGSMWANLKNEVPFDYLPNLKFNSNIDSVKTGMKEVQRFLANEEDNTSRNIQKPPFYFNNRESSLEDDQPFDIIISNILLNPAGEESYMSTFAILPMSQLSHDIFFTGEIPFTNEGVFFDKQNIDELNFLEVWESNLYSENLELDFGNENSSRLFYGCDGLYKVQLDFDVYLPANQYISDSNIDEKIKLDVEFEDEVIDWNNWIIKGKNTQLIKNDSSLNKVDDLTFFFDNSDVINVRDGFYPDNIADPRATARGIVPLRKSEKEFPLEKNINSKAETKIKKQPKNIKGNITKSVEALIFPIGSKEFDSNISWIISDFDVNHIEGSKQNTLSWKVNQNIEDDFRIIIFKSKGNNPLKQVAEITKGVSPEYYWTDSTASNTNKYNYAIRIITNTGKSFTTKKIMIEI